MMVDDTAPNPEGPRDGVTTAHAPMFTRRSAIVTLGVGFGAGLGAGLAGAATFAQNSAPPTYENARDLYAALEYQPNERIVFKQGEIDLVFADGAPGLDRGPVRTWVRHAADAIVRYFGRFPVKQYGLLIIAEDGDTVGHATTFGFAGSATRIHVGRSATAAAFAKDWVLVHEMFHAALPDLPRRALWLQEGNATWTEPVARARAGYLSPTEVWRQARVGMPRGLPEPGEGGMDGSMRWGRLYWGGALFWLTAEIQIAEASHGTKSLRDAMRAISQASGGNSADWSPEQMMLAGDAATGTNVLSRLYARWATERVETDVDAMFARLGVSAQGEGIALDDNAPWAAIRRGITRAG